MSLISERVRLPKLPTAEQRQIVFNWLANFLLVHFLELRLHSLVWNKVSLLVTIDESVDRPEVSWDEEQPELGMGVLIPAGTDEHVLVDFLYEHVDALEAALTAKVHVQAAHARRRRSTATATEQENKETDRGSSQDRRKQRKPHFYAREVSAMFRRS